MRRRAFIKAAVGSPAMIAAACNSRSGGGAHLSPRLLATPSARCACKRCLFSMNCDAAASLKAKTSRSSIAHMGYTLIGFRNMPQSWSKQGSMSLLLPARMK